MIDYPTGSLKWDKASGSVAVRTAFPEVGPMAQHAWLVATTDAGAVTKTSADVQDWADLPVSEPVDD